MYCGSTVDPWSFINNFNASWVMPVGTRANNNYGRYNNKAFSALVDKMGTVSPDDPQTGTLFTQSLEMWLKDLPAFGLNQQLRIVPYVSTYWTNWPTSQNGYIHPPNWWMTSLRDVRGYQAYRRLLDTGREAAYHRRRCWHTRRRTVYLGGSPRIGSRSR